ncbi:thioredoxin family protein [Gammaproteobacteria bacterium]|nr:thioredoxin family protein [Gammaproteobacteria bacterium]MDB9907491.1 thioredoxin family protein [Gammaproteobacteria bacterium]MDC0089856.1 thioredoxin family protein [Gammaproteobacteria bacterium]MDC1387644.1 thioredoxin family protein [Gammaproteobacteria bacterium]
MHIALNPAELPLTPHPEPYCNDVIDLRELKKFIQSSIDLNKQPIIIFGANWCPDARLLEAILQLPSVRQFLDTKSNVLNVDVRDYEINTELFKYFDPEIETGIPRVFILDLNGNPLNMNSNDKMRTARQQSPQKIFDYFQGFITKN